MDATIPVTDTTHATFWRRLVRWLVDGVPDPVAITTAVDRVEPGEPMKLTAEVVDPAFVEVNDAQVLAQVTSPSGKTTEVPLEWTVTHDGEYRGTFVPDEAGVVRSERDGDRASTASRRAAGPRLEHDARARVGRRQRVLRRRDARAAAQAHRGRNRRPLLHAGRRVATLPEAISYSGRGVTVVEERDLWDMPVILILLLALIGARVGTRRQEAGPRQ